MAGFPGVQLVALDNGRIDLYIANRSANAKKHCQKKQTGDPTRTL
jgi:hypothetical protein